MRRLWLLCLIGTAALGSPGFRTFRPDKPPSTTPSLLNPDLTILRFLGGTIQAADECTGAALSTTRGTLAITRNSTAFCTKRDGSLVSLAINTPRLQENGLLSEQPATNKVIRSEELENEAWTASNVTVDATNTVVAPDGTTTAETLTSTSAGGYLESTAFTAGTVGQGTSAYVKTTSGTQDVSIRLRDTTAGADRCTANVTATTTWQRVVCITATGLTTGNNHTLRIFPGATGGTGTSVWWGGMDEASPATSNALVSSYVPTAAAAVARSGDAPTVTGITESYGPLSYFRATVYPPNGGNLGYWFYSPDGTGKSHSHLGSTGLTNQCNYIDGSSFTATSTATLTRGQENTVSCEYTGTQVIACIGATCTTTSPGTFTGTATMTSFGIGRGTSAAGTNALKGMIRNVCIARRKADCDAYP